LHHLPIHPDVALCAQVRQYFESAGYTEPAVTSRLGLAHLSEFELALARRTTRPPDESPLDVLISLFLAGDFVSPLTFGQHIPEAAAALLHQAQLLHTEAAGICATLHLYPVGTLLIASDRWDNPDGTDSGAARELVYPALNPNTRRFLQLLPTSPCEAFLDIGAGTGVAALEAARHGATHAWASDIAESSTVFAEFNRLLNGIDSVTAVTSDVYEQLGGLTFDRIVSHPPYVPSILPRWVFYNGGEDGEQIMRRVVEGLPAHLRPGGLGFILTMGSDRQGRPFELRARDWLGDASPDFDVAFLLHRTVLASVFAARTNPGQVRSQEEFVALTALFARLGVQSLHQGLLLFQRRQGKRQTFTVRRQMPVDFTRDDWEWLLRWEAEAVGPDRTVRILDTPLYTGRPKSFEVRHRLEDDQWVPSGYTLQIDRPFIADCDADPWMANLIAICDGKSTGRDHMKTLQRGGVIPKDTPATEFAKALAGLISGGFVEVEGFRPPQAAG